MQSETPKMTIPKDFPRDPWPAAVSGVQPKFAARKIGGRFVVGLTPEELAVRYDNCQDLVVQLTAYCQRKLAADSALTLDSFLPKVEQSCSKKSWDVSPIELTWIMSKVRLELPPPSMTFGPDKTPLKPWTTEQAEADKGDRLTGDE